MAKSFAAVVLVPESVDVVGVGVAVGVDCGKDVPPKFRHRLVLVGHVHCGDD